MDFYPVTWSASDDGPGDTCRITAYGKTPSGKAVCVHVRFTPYFFVKLPRDWSDARGRLFLAECARKHDIVESKSTLVQRKCMWGYQAGRDSTFAQLAFRSIAMHRRARYSVGREHETYEAGVDPLVRLFHLRGISPCSWVHVASWAVPDTKVADVDAMDAEIECALGAVGPSTVTDRPPLVFASFDLECFSASGKFPVSDKPDDCIINIATTFQRYTDPEPYARVVVCHRETAEVTGTDIIWRHGEHEVIDEWARLVRAHKADVLVGYNTAQ